MQTNIFDHIPIPFNFIFKLIFDPYPVPLDNFTVPLLLPPGKGQFETSFECMEPTRCFSHQRQQVQVDWRSSFLDVFTLKYCNPHIGVEMGDRQPSAMCEIVITFQAWLFDTFNHLSSGDMTRWAPQVPR